MISRPVLVLMVSSAAVAGIWVGLKTNNRSAARPVTGGGLSPVPVRYLDNPVVPPGVIERGEATAHVDGSRSPVDAGVDAAAPVAGMGVPAAAVEPTREELEFRAFKVEQLANKELRNLLGVLELDEEEQDRVFAALARRSGYYHPSLQVQNLAGGEISMPALPVTPRNPSTPSPGALLASNDGSANDGTASGSDAPDPVIDALPPELMPRYREYKSEREQFWAGVVEKIESQLEPTSSGN